MHYSAWYSLRWRSTSHCQRSVEAVGCEVLNCKRRGATDDPKPTSPFSLHETWKMIAMIKLVSGIMIWQCNRASFLAKLIDALRGFQELVLLHFKSLLGSSSVLIPFHLQTVLSSINTSATPNRKNPQERVHCVCFFYTNATFWLSYFWLSFFYWE